MAVFFIRYRKILLLGSGYLFLYFFYEMYRGIESINSNNGGKSIGTLIDACIALFVSAYFFINVRKANRASQEENAAAETNSGNSPEV
jgi:hypothetical protein